MGRQWHRLGLGTLERRTAQALRQRRQCWQGVHQLPHPGEKPGLGVYHAGVIPDRLQIAVPGMPARLVMSV